MTIYFLFVKVFIFAIGIIVIYFLIAIDIVYMNFVTVCCFVCVAFLFAFDFIN